MHFQNNLATLSKRHVKIEYEGNKNGCKQCHYKGKTNKVLENKMISTMVIFFTLVFSVVSNQWVGITLENISRENTRKVRTQMQLAKLK